MAVRLEPATSASGDSKPNPSVREGGQKGHHRWSTVKRQWPAAVCCALYMVLAMVDVRTLRFARSEPHDRNRLRWTRSSQIWWLAWAAHALPEVHNLFLAQGQNYPFGQNFGVNGSMLALGVVFMPITKLFGPVVTWNIAACVWLLQCRRSRCALVLRRWTTWWPAAFLGGLLYGFSAYTYQLGAIPVSHLRAVATVDLPAPPRDPGATALAAVANRGSARPRLCPSVLHLDRGPCRHGGDGQRSRPACSSSSIAAPWSSDGVTR